MGESRSGKLAWVWFAGLVVVLVWGWVAWGGRVLEPVQALYVSGRVEGPDGAPMAEAHVDTSEARTRTDSEGRFVLGPVGEGEHLVSASHLGAGLRDAYVIADAGDSDVRLRLQSGGALEGVVRGMEGAGSGCVVTVRASDDPVRYSASTSTDDEGRFAIERLPPGSYVLDATDSAWGFASYGVVTLRLGETHDGVELVLGPGARLRLVGPYPSDGFLRCRGASGAEVPVWRAREGESSSAVLAPGRYVVEAVAWETGEAVELRTVELTAGEEVEVELGGS